MGGPKQILPKEEIVLDPASSVDPFGTVFWHDGQVFRSVTSESEPLAREILARAPGWVDYGLVETSESSYRTEEASLVLSHRTITYRSYCTEWIPEMLRDAALSYLRLQLKLVEDGYLLKDGHPWNVLFDGGRPVYVDVGSITPFNGARLTHSLEEFRLYFLLPLMLLSASGSEKTYAVLNRPIPNPEEREEVARQMRLPAVRSPGWFGPRYGLKRLIRKVERLKISGVKRTEWTGYEQKAPDVTDPDSFIEKQQPAYEVLKRKGSGTLLDIGCSKGWYSLLAENMGFSVVSVDIDLDSLGILYDKVKRGQRNILPLHVDICRPTGASGLGGVYPAFIDRMKSDVVFAMAVIHHLSYKRKLSFETFAERIAQITRNVAVVEFIPREDMYVSKWDQGGMEWYTRRHFVEAFMRHFDRVEAFPSTPVPREVFVFEKAGT